ncbi:MAG: hypothetical protein ACOYMN_19835, partial [Roseimicrobium sp.]
MALRRFEVQARSGLRHTAQGSQNPGAPRRQALNPERVPSTKVESLGAKHAIAPHAALLRTAAKGGSRTERASSFVFDPPPAPLPPFPRVVTRTTAPPTPFPHAGMALNASQWHTFPSVALQTALPTS